MRTSNLRTAVTTCSVFVLLVIAACGTLESDMVVTGQPRAMHGGPVRVVMEGQPKPAGFEEIGIVQAIGTGSKADLGTVTEAIQREAAQVGANTVINVRFDRGSNNASATGIAGYTP